MRRFIFLFFITLCSAVLLARYAYGLTAEQKREMFLKAREQMHVEPPSKTTPAHHPKPRVKPKPAPRVHHQTERHTTTHRHETPRRQTHSQREHHTTHTVPKPTPASTPDKSTAPKKQRAGDYENIYQQEQDRHGHHQTTHRAEHPATPKNTPAAAITINKSGYEKSKGNVPPPPEPKKHGFWLFNLFRHSSSRGTADYHYLTSAVREAIDHPNHPVKRGRWRYIVVHNSGTKQGNAKSFNYYHLHVRHMPNGLAYQFVIDNGHGGPDGRIEIGNRWMRQIQGGHVHSDYLNEISLGICLVGDFNRGHPTKAQLTSLKELIHYLQKRVGKIDGHWPVVVPHRAINPPRWGTDCPGNLFPYSWLRRNFPPPDSSENRRLQYDRRVPSSDR